MHLPSRFHCVSERIEALGLGYSVMQHKIILRHNRIMFFNLLKAIGNKATAACKGPGA